MEVADESFLKAVRGRRISIFLSIWDVHVNRAPMAGRFGKVEYRPGRFYNAMRSRASVENEQKRNSPADRGVERWFFKQIAGAISAARGLLEGARRHRKVGGGNGLV